MIESLLGNRTAWIQLGLVLAHFLWQGAAIAMLLASALWLLRRRSPNVRYLLCGTAMLLMAACPVLTLVYIRAHPLPLLAMAEQDIREPVNRPDHEPARRIRVDRAADDQSAPPLPVSISETDAGASVAVEGGEHSDTRVAKRSESPSGVGDIAPAPRAFESLSSKAGSALRRVWLARGLTISALAWSIGVLTLSVRLMIGWWRLRRMSRRDTESLPEGIEAIVRRLTQRLQITRCVRVLASRSWSEPIAFGLLRPVVLMPIAVLTQCPVELIEAMIAHELAHIRRYDLWVNLAQRVIETLLFYHPAVWWVSGRMRLERELCCDDLAISATGRRADYASALVELCRVQPGMVTPAMAAGIFGPKLSLLTRVRRILQVGSGAGESNRGRFWLAGPLSILLAGAFVFIACTRVANTRSVAATQPAVDRLTSAPPASPHTDVPWGEVIERDVNADSVGKDCLLDFDNGKLVTPPKNPDGGFPAWFKKTGVDVGCTTEAASPGLWGFDMVVIPVEAKSWDQGWDEGVRSTLLSHLSTGQPGTPAVMSAAGPLPATYMFKTREGSAGILQIMTVERNAPPHIKVRYKLLQTEARGATTRPATKRAVRISDGSAVIEADRVDIEMHPQTQPAAVSLTAEAQASRNAKVRISDGSTTIEADRIDIVMQPQKQPAEIRVPVRSLADGIVTEVAVQEGQAVKKGDLLVRLDDEEIRIELRGSEVRLRVANETFEIAKVMRQKGLAAGTEYSKAQSEVSLAETDVERWSLRLKRTQIKSPADGVIRISDGDRAGLVGKRVTAGDVLLYIDTTRVGAPVREARRQAKPLVRHFVKLVLGKGRMTFQGDDVTWDELPGLLERVPDREHTVFEFVNTSEDLTLREFNAARFRAMKLQEQFGFEYFSEVGEHPLGSKGAPDQVLPADSTPSATQLVSDRLVMRVFTLKHVNADLIIQSVQTMLNEKPEGGRINADKKTNSLVMTATETDTNRIAYFIAQLDRPKSIPLTQPADTDEKTVRVIQVKHAKPTAVADAITGLYQPTSFPDNETVTAIMAQEAIRDSVTAQGNDEKKTVLLSYHPSKEGEILALIAQLDTPGSADISFIKLFPVRYAKPEELEHALRATAKEFGVLCLITLDPRTSSLIVEADLAGMKIVEKLLSKIDRPARVLKR